MSPIQQTAPVTNYEKNTHWSLCNLNTKILKILSGKLSRSQINFPVPLSQPQKPENSILKSAQSLDEHRPTNILFQYCYSAMLLGCSHSSTLLFSLPSFHCLSVLWSASIMRLLAMKRLGLWPACSLNCLSHPHDWPIHINRLFALMTKKRWRLPYSKQSRHHAGAMAQ